MADLVSQLASLLAGERVQQSIAAENPYTKLQVAPDILTSLAVQGAQQPGRYDTKELVLASLLGGLGSGVLGGMGESYAADKTAAYNDVVANLISGKPASQGDLSDSLFRQADTTAKLFNMQRQIGNEQADMEVLRDLKGKVSQLYLEKPWLREDLASDPVAQQLLGITPTKPKQEIAQDAQVAQAEGGKIAEPANLPQTPQVKIPTNPEDPRYKAMIDNENKLRDEYSKDSVRSTYKLSKMGMESLVKALNDPDSTSDIELVRGAIQAIEPGMAVQQGEQAAVAQSPSIPDQWRGALNKALLGGTALPDGVREGILRIAARRYQAQANQFNLLRSDFTELSQRRKVMPENVVFDVAPLPLSDIWPDYEKSLQAAKIKAGDLTPSGITVPSDKLAETQAKIAQMKAQGIPDQDIFKALSSGFSGTN